MSQGVLGLALVLALMDWIATWREWRRVRWLTKPAVLAAVIAWFSLAGGWQGALVWFGLGLACSLAGDIFLLFPGRFFLPGLSAFLIAHVCYIVGLNARPVAWSWSAVLLLGLAGMLISWTAWGLIRRVCANPACQEVLVPVVIYTSVISLMVLSALLCFFRPGWPTPARILVAAGAGLFFVSDRRLALDRFCQPMQWGEVVVMVTYHLGQFGLAGGALAFGALRGLALHS